MTQALRSAGYDEIQSIGRGNMGVVYRARKCDSGDEVAIKVIPGGVAADERERMTAERNGAELQQKIAARDAHVVAVNQIRDLNGDLLVEMEYVAGGDLHKSIQAGSRDNNVAARVALELCCMLENLNGLSPPVVHGDLKPRNVLLGGKHGVKVADFGIAKALSKGDGTVNVYLSLPYSSPERLESGRVNAQSDLWSVGVMLYEMVSGGRPFNASDGRLRQRILDGRGPDPFPPGSCEEPLRKIILKALAQSPDDRYSSAKAMADDLQRFLSGDPVLASPLDDQATRRTRPPNNSRPHSSKASGPQVTQKRKGSWASRLTTAGVVFAIVLFAIHFVSRQSNAYGVATNLEHQLDSGLIESSEGWKRYQELQRQAVFPLTKLRLALKKRLVWEARVPVEDYRQDRAGVREGDWSRAAEKLRRALELDSSDNAVRAKLLLCEAHVMRIQAKKGSRVVDPKTLNQAIRQFEEAAKLVPESADPYLGLARIYFYDEPDYERGADMLTQASKRGHALGRREKLQAADALRMRAIRNLQEVRRFRTSPAREIEYLKSIAVDLRSAIEGYQGVAYDSPNVPDLLMESERRLQQVESRIQKVEQTLQEQAGQ